MLFNEIADLMYFTEAYINTFNALNSREVLTFTLKSTHVKQNIRLLHFFGF